MVYSANRFLTQTEMTVNAQYILDYLSSRGWSKNAICGMLGNMETESAINPGIWQGLNANHAEPWGYGLVQWTPSTKYTDWCNVNGLSPSEMDSALKRIEYELANGLQWIATKTYNFSFSEFKAKTETPEYLADAFLKCYERPADQTQPNRGTQARYWFDTLVGGGSSVGGYQLAKFPMDMIHITQGENGSFSHDGTWAMDFVGTTKEYPYYAPCDCECIGRNDAEAILTWKSKGQVICADGVVRQIHWRNIHDNVLDFNVGDTLLKGQLMGQTGNGGNSSGDHWHLDVWLGDVFTRTNPLHIYDVFAVNGANIVHGLGYPWKTSDYVDGTTETPPNNQTDKNKKIVMMLLADTLNGWRW